jgi:uncharacterized protein involved in exopolysaccharide biosynthesis
MQETNGLSPSLILAMLWRRRYWFIGVAAAIFIASFLLAFGLPSVYRSQSTILIEQQEIPQDMVRGAVTSFADQRVQIISQRVMTRSNLLDIIRKFDLYADLIGKETNEALIGRMREGINLNMVSADVVDPRSGRPTQATIAFTLAFDYGSPAIAQRVTNELTTLYLNENVKNRTQRAADTSDFLAEESDKLSRQIIELETRLADFKTENAGRLPELSDMNMQMLDRTDRDLMNMEQQIRALEERRIYLESQIAQTEPSEVLYNEVGQRIQGPAERYRMLQTRYVSLSSLYNPNHPDVVRAQKEIDALRQELGLEEDAGEDQMQALAELRSELMAARGRYSDSHPDVRRLEREVAALSGRLSASAPVSAESAQAVKSSFDGKASNPVYVELQTRLEVTNTEMRALLRSRDNLRAKMDEYERRLLESPAVEKDYRALVRDYESSMLKYRETRAKMMEAQLSRSLELERKGERFTLIEPPSLPETPISPNRKVIVFLGIMLSMLAGGGVAYLRDRADDSIWSGAYSGPSFGLTAPMIIPYINTDEDEKRRMMMLGLGALSIVCILASAALAMHFFYSPLDVFWYSTVRRLGGG